MPRRHQWTQNPRSTRDQRGGRILPNLRPRIATPAAVNATNRQTPEPRGAWRLVVLRPPDRLGGLLAKLGFGAVKSGSGNWSKLFHASREQRDQARYVLAQLRDAGLAWRWIEVASPQLRAEQKAQFTDYKAEMAKSKMPPPQPLPKPIDAPGVGLRMPGLSKGAPDPYRYRR